MEHRSPSEVTLLLQGWREGDSKALDALLPLVYKELHRLARFHLRSERPITRYRAPTWFMKPTCAWSA